MAVVGTGEVVGAGGVSVAPGPPQADRPKPRISTKIKDKDNFKVRFAKFIMISNLLLLIIRIKLVVFSRREGTISLLL